MPNRSSVSWPEVASIRVRTAHRPISRSGWLTLVSADRQSRPRERHRILRSAVPTLVHSFRFTMNRFYNPSVAASQSGDWPNTLGLGTFGAGNFLKISFYGSSYDNAYNMSTLGSQFNDFYAASTFNYNDDLTRVRGRHTLRFGGEFGQCSSIAMPTREF